MNNLSSYALITGGSSGIGYQFARELAKKKYNLIIVSNEDLKNQEVCLTLSQEFHIQAIPFFIDLTGPESAEILFNFCIEQQLDVDILINNAGMFFFKEIPDTSPEMVSKILMLHIVTSTLLSTYFSNYMRKKKIGTYLIYFFHNGLDVLSRDFSLWCYQRVFKAICSFTALRNERLSCKYKCCLSECHRYQFI